MTTVITKQCGGKINGLGYCDSCGQKSESTSNRCVRYIQDTLRMFNTKQKTALQKVIEKIDAGIAAIDLIPDTNSLRDVRDTLLSVRKDCESHLPEEREVIELAFDNGNSNGEFEKRVEDGEQYFNETYGSETD